MWLCLQQVSADTPGLIYSHYRGTALGMLLFTHGLPLGTCSQKNTVQILKQTCKYLSLWPLLLGTNEPEPSLVFPGVLCMCKS